MACTFLLLITELKYSSDCPIIFFFLTVTVAQIMFTLYLEVVRNLPQPAVMFVMIGDILLDEKVVDTFRKTRMHLLVNPTRKEVMDTGSQLQAKIWPLLWKNLVIEKE